MVVYVHTAVAWKQAPSKQRLDSFWTRPPELSNSCAMLVCATPSFVLSRVKMCRTSDLC